MYIGIYFRNSYNNNKYYSQYIILFTSISTSLEIISLKLIKSLLLLKY